MVESAVFPWRFMAKVDQMSDDGCWNWTACVVPGRGYGLFSHEGRLQLAHRVAYKIGVGPIPPGYVVMHTCDNVACVRPDHLRAGTQSENIRDMDAKGRRAEFYPKKLTPEKAAEIRRLAEAAFGDGPAMRAIAAKFGISARTVREIRIGRTWSPLHRRRPGRTRHMVDLPA